MTTNVINVYLFLGRCLHVVSELGVLESSLHEAYK